MLCQLAHCLFLALLMALSGTTNAQKDTVLHQYSLHVEIGGPGGYGSVGYEYLFLRKEYYTLSMKGGVGVFHLRDFRNNLNPDILIPLGCHFLRGRKHLMEIALGETFHSIVKSDQEDYGSSRQVGWSSFAIAGYRYKHAGGRFILRVFYNPLIEFNRYFRHWGGISFGYAL